MIRRDALTPRALLIQGLVLAALVALMAFLASNVAANVVRMNVHTGFGFLARRAGFDIALKLVPYTEESSYLATLWVALANTVLVAVLSCFFATLLGVVIGIGRLSTNRLMATVAGCYVQTVRNVPLLLQLFYWYFAVLATLPVARRSLALFNTFFLNNRGLTIPAPVPRPGLAPFLLAFLVGLGVMIACGRVARRRRAAGRPSALRWIGPATAMLLLALAVAVAGRPIGWDVPKLVGLNFRGGVTVIPELVAMATALSVYGAAFIAELVRGAVKSVPPGQMEAGLALGLPKWRAYTMIVLPQAMRALVPPLANQYISILKNSSLGAAIGYPDLMLVWGDTVLNQTGQPIEVMFTVMATYLLLCLMIVLAANVVNRRVQLVEH